MIIADTNILGKFLDFALEILPISPLAGFVDYFASLPYLGYINWFVPVGTCVDIMLVWLGAIATYYLVMVIMRWAKMII